VPIVEGNITAQNVDAIVNAAKVSLLGGGRVDGAIHRAAGPGLLHECRRIGGDRTGEACLSGRHALTARHMVHTGAYRFPLERATHIAITEVLDHVGAASTLENVVFVCFGGAVYRCYCEVIADISARQSG